MTAKTQSNRSLTDVLMAAEHSVRIYRSSFPPSSDFSGEYQAAISFMSGQRPDVDLEVLTEPTMSDPFVFVRVDGQVIAGPIDAQPRWIPLPDVTALQFDEFFRDQRAILKDPVTLPPYNATPPGPAGTTLINDWSRLNETPVAEVIGPKSDRFPWSCFTPTELDICNVIDEVAAEGGQISIAGRRHSQGGQTFARGAHVIDITDFDEILGFDAKAQTINVQTGITWDKIQRFIQPHGLSVRVMQAYPYFTVGGSLGVSVHDSDLRFGPLVETVNSIRLALADGTVLTASRTENSELFGLAIGGFGLIGFILDVELQLTDDIALEQQPPTDVPAEHFLAEFRALQAKPGVINAYARPNFAPGADFLKVFSLVHFTEVGGHIDPSIFEIVTQKYVGLRKFLYDLSRRYRWAMQMRWRLESEVGDNFGGGVVSRNNQMRADIRIPGDYRSTSDTDALQEYFIPVERFAEFIADLRSILTEHRVNVMSAGVRFVPKSQESVLSYSCDGDVFGIVLVINHETSSDALETVTAWTRRIIDHAIAHGGRYYLPYAGDATVDQCHQAYPRMADFMIAKSTYDPATLFDSQFNRQYSRHPSS